MSIVDDIACAVEGHRFSPREKHRRLRRGTEWEWQCQRCRQWFDHPEIREMVAG